LSDKSLSPTAHEGAEALGLSVHSLPSVQDSTQAAAAVTGRWKMLAIVLVCSLPVLASYFAYYVVRPQGRAGYGELLDPVRPLPELTGTTLDGVVQPLASLKGQWLLLAVAGGACAQDCQQRLFLQRQLREMLGKDRERVDAVWLVSDPAAVDPTLRPGLQDATVLRVASASLAPWLVVPPGHAMGDYLFVIDPLGNAMMRFPALFDGPGAARAKRDLERLLRASAAWDPPGR
jgi:hypothetical protein